MVKHKLAANVRSYYRDDMSYEKFEIEELWWLRSPQDVRFIDSVYRNRDMGKARRGEIVLDKWWTDGGEMLEKVKGWDSTKSNGS